MTNMGMFYSKFWNASEGHDFMVRVYRGLNWMFTKDSPTTLDLATKDYNELRADSPDIVVQLVKISRYSTSHPVVQHILRDSRNYKG